jgi:hypothetical protein
MDCFAALAMTLIQFRLLAARCARAVLVVSPSNQEGAGNAGCRLAPAVSCANSAGGCAHEHTGTAGAARHSLRDGFTAYTELSLETNSFCLHRRRIEGSSKSGWISQNLRRLDASNGRQNHTALPSAFHAVRRRAAFAHEQAHPAKTCCAPGMPRPPLPAPNVRDDRDTPLLWARDGGSCKGDLGSTRSGIFLIPGLDAVSENQK